VTIESRALRRAVELAGSRESLAERVDVKVEELEKWLAGTRRPPREVFLRIVDLILDELPAPASSSDPPESAPSRPSGPVDANS
jgi:hypothetical protein